MPSIILTGSIRHLHLSNETLYGTWLNTDYQILTDNSIEVIQSWEEESLKPFPITQINMNDLRSAIKDQKGWL